MKTDAFYNYYVIQLMYATISICTFAYILSGDNKYFTSQP